jgi:CMP-2-keto-3-deoxyoctulosonic acid synthetase
LQYASWEQTPLEKIEYNEYLRILEHGFKIRAVPVEHADISVDTPDDLAMVREIMKKDPLKKAYLKSV